MLTLNDGRSELWQWDTGRTLAVDADCSQVHFSNKVFGRSIDVDVVGGVAIIPDILLQTDNDLNVWAFVGTAGKYCESDIVVENTKDGGGATEPYIEETYDRSGKLTAAVMHGHLAVRDSAFKGCSALASVTIPDSVTSIGSNAFSRCAGLTSMAIPSSVTIIGTEAFYYCTGLTSVTIPSSVVNIKYSAFEGCRGLTSVTFNGTPSLIGSSAFGNCSNLTTINVPWAEGAVSGAPWGATKATINYDYTGA